MELSLIHTKLYYSLVSFLYFCGMSAAWFFNYYKLLFVTTSYKSAQCYMSLNEWVFLCLINDHAVSTYVRMEV
jgi:hypothetical protein